MTSYIHLPLKRRNPVEHGEPVTAADFVYAWLKQMSADATNGYSFIMTDYIVNGQEYNEGSVDGF